MTVGARSLLMAVQAHQAGKEDLTVRIEVVWELG